MKYTDHPREVECVSTPLAFEQARNAVATAFKQEFGFYPSTATLAVLLAQSALETGRWSRGIYCFNLGNKKCSLDYPGFHQYFRCNEVLDGEVKWFDPPHPQTRFRAYKSAAEGARAYVRFLGVDTTPHNGRPNLYARAWAAALVGDVGTFVRELKSAGYFTADLNAYARAVTSLFHEYRQALADYRPADVAPFDVAPFDEPVEGEHSPFSNADVERVWGSVKRTAHGMLEEFWTEEFRQARDVGE